MNTIKEQSTVNVVAKDAKSYEIGFEAGANYVLDEIVKVVFNGSSCEKAILNLGQVITKLKLGYSVNDDAPTDGVVAKDKEK